jgi:hypothetical protein
VVAARIAVVGVVVCALQLCAQQVPQGHLTIRVTDVTGAVVPGARVTIDPARVDCNSDLRTDNQGEFTCNLDAGSHTISVVSPGFKKWTSQINIQGDTDQRLAVTLDISGLASGPIVTVEWFPTEPVLSPEPVFIPSLPLATLPLAPKPIKKHEKKANL